MAFDIIQKRWSDEKHKIASADEKLLAATEPSENIVGCLECSTSKALGLQGKVYAITGGHDQTCGAIWAAIMGQAKAMHATGTSDVSTSVFDRPYLKKSMLDNNYACYPYVIKDQYMSISVNPTGGLLLKWYRDNLCLQEMRQAKKEKGAWMRS